MTNIDLSKYKDQLKTKRENGVSYILDIIRKKYIVLQPEEVVRQLCILYLINEKDYSRNYIQVEKQFLINGLSKRFDIVVYDVNIRPYILVECKSPSVDISQLTLDQAARYNHFIEAPYIILTNGITTRCCSVNSEKSTYELITDVPDYNNQS